MKKESRQQRTDVRTLRQKLRSAAMMLLIAAILMTSSSYAWFILATAPEATGITTNIGANGSLEIALLNTETYQDTSRITAKLGDSIEVQSRTAANVTWGNLVDLSDPSYGLSNINLLPARLNFAASNSKVSAGLLAIPSYGYDGRIKKLNKDTVTTTFQSGKFNYDSLKQQYGVRAVGVAADQTSASATLSYAKTAITAFAGSARSEASAAFSTYGSALAGIIMQQKLDSSTTYRDSDIEIMKNVVSGLSNSLDYIDLAFRYAILAPVAAADPENFAQMRDYILDTNNELSTVYDTLVSLLPEDMELQMPDGMTEQIGKLNAARNDVNFAMNSCNALSGGSYTWSQLTPIMEKLMNMDHVFINDDKFGDIDPSAILGSSSFTLTLAPGSGVPAEIADFAGNFSCFVNYAMYTVEITTQTTTNPTILAAASAFVNELEGSGSGGAYSAELSDVCGYALDLAFRCNAEVTDLQLQTTPEQRVYSDSTAVDTQGGGSYMQFSTKSKTMDTGRMILLMDAVRVGFLDNAGNILGIAKLNTSNRTVNADGSVKASLYLYHYAIDEEGVMVMGERRLGDNKITSLKQNTVKTLTVVVWLDGDTVDNTMVAIDTEASLSGVLNLQFSSSKELRPAGIDELAQSNVTQAQLNDLLNQKDILNVLAAGQGTYTDLSWNAFVAAYENAVNVSEASSVSFGQVTAAYNDLLSAWRNLTVVSATALSEMIAEVRELMGTTDEMMGYAINGAFALEYTQESADNSPKIYRVDDSKNLHDEGNGIKTNIYKPSSWDALAQALYQAEAAAAYANATDELISAQTTALDVAYTTLERAVFYEPYDYNNEIFYFAISDDPDTYGKWYDSNYKRIVSDKMILNLDAGAVKAKFASIEVGGYYDVDSETTLAPQLSLNKKAYPAIAGEEIIGALWSVSGSANSFQSNSAQSKDLNVLIARAESVMSESYDEQSDLLGEIEMAEQIIAGEKWIHDGETEPRVNTELETERFINDFAAKIALEEAKFDLDRQEKADHEAADAEAKRQWINANEKQILAAAIAEARKLLIEADIDVGALEAAAAEENAVVEVGDEDTPAALKTLGTCLVDALKVQNKGDLASKDETNSTIDSLNAAISAAGGTPKTAYNTIVYKLPDVYASADYVNRVVLPSTTVVTDKTLGDITISATILTKNGVLYSTAKTVKAYRPYEKIEITRDGTETSITADSISAGTTANYGVIPVKRIVEGEPLPSNEKITGYLWSVSDSNLVTISDTESSICTVNALSGASGTVTLSVSVEMDTGSIYSASIPLTVG